MLNCERQFISAYILDFQAMLANERCLALIGVDAADIWLSEVCPYTCVDNALGNKHRSADLIGDFGEDDEGFHAERPRVLRLLDHTFQAVALAAGHGGYRCAGTGTPGETPTACHVLLETHGYNR